MRIFCNAKDSHILKKKQKNNVFDYVDDELFMLKSE